MKRRLKMALGGYPDSKFSYLKNVKGIDAPEFAQGTVPTMPQDMDTPKVPGANMNKIAGTAGSVAGLASTAVDAIDKPDKYGVRTGFGAAASGTLKGAAAGAKLGSSIPIVGTAAGAVVGAGVGLVSGILGNKKAQREKEKAIRLSTDNQMRDNQMRSDAVLAADPEAATGRRNASLYKFGGTMKGGGVTPPRLIKPIPKVQGSIDVMPNVAQVPGRQLSRKATGGAIVPLSSEDVKVEGPSHAQGGVKLPSLGVEVEGGETMNDGFVFSDKLGFASEQEKVAKKLGRIEKMPDTVLNRTTANALKRKTGFIKMAQEATKAQMGIPNDLEKKAMGGPVDPERPNSRIGNLRSKPMEGVDMAKVKTLKEKDPANAWRYDSTVGYDVNSAKTVLPSTKAMDLDNTYLPSRNIAVNKTPDVIPRGVNSYAFGGQTDPGPKKKVPPPNLDGGLSPASIENAAGFVGSKLMSGIKWLRGHDYDNTNGVVTSTTPVAPAAPLVPKAPAVSSTASVIPTGKKPPVVSSGASNRISGRRLGTTTAKTTVAPAVTGDKFPLTKKGDDSIPNIPELGAPVNPVGKVQVKGLTMDAPVIKLPPAAESSKRRSVVDNINAVADQVTPFISNINNSLTKLPLPPVPTMDDQITPSTVDYSSSRAEAVRASRGADKTANQNLNSGAAVSATKAANLSQQVRSVGQINEQENNTNTSIRNQASQVNAGIRANNNAKKDNYQNELVSRTLKGQELRSQNLANIEEKIQGISRDKKLFDLEDQKVMLEALKDDTGASFRGAKTIFAKHLSPESMAEVQAHYDQTEKDNQEDRATARTAGKLQLDFLKKNKNAVTADGTPIQRILGNVSTVTTSKEDNANRKKK